MFFRWEARSEDLLDGLIWCLQTLDYVRHASLTIAGLHIIDHTIAEIHEACVKSPVSHDLVAHLERLLDAAAQSSASTAAISAHGDAIPLPPE